MGEAAEPWGGSLCLPLLLHWNLMSPTAQVLPEGEWRKSQVEPLRGSPGSNSSPTLLKP